MVEMEQDRIADMLGDFARVFLFTFQPTIEGAEVDSFEIKTSFTSANLSIQVY